MGTCSWLATLLDQEMIEAPAVATLIPTGIAQRTTPDTALTLKTGAQVAQELRGRLLLRYLLPHQVGSFTSGASGLHYTTPTAYAPGETTSWLALPQPHLPRLFVMLLDPSRIPEIKGPRWVRFGNGIEYLLPNGFPAAALRLQWEVSIA